MNSLNVLEQERSFDVDPIEEMRMRCVPVLHGLDGDFALALFALSSDRLTP